MIPALIQKCWRKTYEIQHAASYPLMSRAAKAYLALWGVRCGSGLRIDSLPLCRRAPDAVIEIGAGVRIINKLSENLAGAHHRTVLAAVQPGARLIVGDHVGLSGVILYCTQEIVIEDHVMVCTGARIYDTDFHSLDPSARRRPGQEEITQKSVRICRDAWVGANAIVLRGVTIGARSVISAGAIVTRSCPPDSIVAGNPARVVGRIGDAGLRAEEKLEAVGGAKAC